MPDMYPERLLCVFVCDVWHPTIDEKEAARCLQLTNSGEIPTDVLWSSYLKWIKTVSSGDGLYDFAFNESKLTGQDLSIPFIPFILIHSNILIANRRWLKLSLRIVMCISCEMFHYKANHITAGSYYSVLKMQLSWNNCQNLAGGSNDFLSFVVNSPKDKLFILVK